MFKSSKSEKNDKLYEFRYYRIAAQDIGRFKELASQHVPHRANRSKLVGFWVTDLGAVNYVLHIWEYDSLTHRKAIREEMYADAEWSGFLGQVSPMFQKMDNWLCKATHGDFSTVWSDKEFYKLTTVRFAPSENLDCAKRQFKYCANLKRDGFKAAFQTIVGNCKEFFLLESANNPDDFLDNPNQLESSVSTTVDTKILSPLPWNQWLQQQ